MQDIIPVQRVYDDGIFMVCKNKYSMTFRFTDINYAVADDDDKLDILSAYADFLSTLDPGMDTKITINNHRLSQSDIEKNILIPDAGDYLDRYRHEFNDMILEKATGSQSMVQDKYITLSVYKRTVEEARSYFNQIYLELSLRLNSIGCTSTILNLDERLRIFHDFFRSDDGADYDYDIRQKRRRGHSFMDVICPESIETNSDYFKTGDRYCRVLYLKEYGSFVNDTIIEKLTSLQNDTMLSVDIIPIPYEEAIKEAESRLLGVETEITNWQRRQNRNNNFSATVPYDLEQQRAELKDFLNDLTKNDRRMTLAVVTLLITADSKKELDSNTKAVMNTAMGHHCQLGVLNFQQTDGMMTVMPFGELRIDHVRTLTTESLTAFAPFRAQDLFHPGGMYMGQNTVTNNIICVDVTRMLNGNSMIFGVPGGGKSMTAKYSTVFRLISDPNCEVIIIDPEREYSALVRAMGGAIVFISSTSSSHINPMEINSEYGEGANPIILKSEFLMLLIEQLIGYGRVGSKEKSIIDRCASTVYRPYQMRDYTGTPPTLLDFYEELKRQPEPEAKDLALSIELFTSGSLNTFAQQTNVDINNRLICYDILDLGKQLATMGMLVVLDNIFNRITRNRSKGKRTYIFIDEIYLLFQDEYSANFLFTLWKRVRKYGAFATGITQNVEDMLQSHTASTMLSNSEFLVMLNQSPTDREELAKLLNITDNQLSFISNAQAGTGLMKIGSSLVPFTNTIPTNTEMYKLMSTKPGEGV